MFLINTYKHISIKKKEKRKRERKETRRNK